MLVGQPFVTPGYKIQLTLRRKNQFTICEIEFWYPYIRHPSLAPTILLLAPASSITPQYNYVHPFFQSIVRLSYVTWPLVTFTPLWITDLSLSLGNIFVSRDVLTLGTILHLLEPLRHLTTLAIEDCWVSGSLHHSMTGSVPFLPQIRIFVLSSTDLTQDEFTMGLLRSVLPNANDAHYPLSYISLTTFGSLFAGWEGDLMHRCHYYCLWCHLHGS